MVALSTHGANHTYPPPSCAKESKGDATWGRIHPPWGFLESTTWVTETMEVAKGYILGPTACPMT